ncbi:MAG: GntR family transcriptional regulator [Paludibaculum sp.]
MIPFSVSFAPGVPIYEQVVYAAKKAILAGDLASGERFPSVRALSQELKINANTAHKVVIELVAEGLLEVQPGLGTVVAARPVYGPSDRAHLLKNEVEHLVVEAKRLGVTLDGLLSGIVDHWHELTPQEDARRRPR